MNITQIEYECNINARFLGSVYSLIWSGMTSNLWGLMLAKSSNFKLSHYELEMQDDSLLFFELQETILNIYS